MLSNTLSFLSFRNVSDKASHPYKTTGKIIVLYITETNVKQGKVYGVKKLKFRM